jgi:hypothetical protein
MAYKPCPKCDKFWGPRTKKCSCGHVFIKDDSNDSDDSEDFTNTKASIKPEKRNCANCGSEFESIGCKFDSYDTVSYIFRFEHYCGSNCLEESSERKDDLLEELLNFSNLEAFFEEKSKDQDYKSLFEYILSKSIKEKKLSDYLDTHPKITFTTPPKPKRFLTAKSCEEVGLRPPPKIGDYQNADPEVPELSKLSRLLLKKEEVTFDDEDSDSSEEENSEEDIEGEDFGDNIEEVEEEKPNNALSALLGIKSISTQPIVKEIVKSNTNVDMTTMPRQGQKKCGWKNKVYSGKGCGFIVGVRTGNCPKCNYQF